MSRPEPNTTDLLPCPTPVPAGNDSILPVDRLVFCPLYQGCLDMAVHSGWEDFTCRRCPIAPWQGTPSAALLATRQPKD